ncbi:MAG: hypothetical protein R6U15_00215 [Candidatus Izemoplasmatales bacterium]
MKKAFFIIIIAYIVTTVIILVINNNDNITEVNILTIKKQYSRIITKDEVIDIPIFLSEEKSFFIEPENILDTRIKADNNEIEVNIQSIENAYKKTTYQNESYYLFYYKIDFKEFNNSLLEMKFTNAFLSLSYNNETDIDLPIGNLNLCFRTIENFNHLDFKRMYSITNYENNYNVVKAIYLELDNLTGDNITIENISLLNDNLIPDINQIKSINFSPKYNVNFNELIPDYNSIIDDYSKGNDYSLNNNQKLLIPIKHIGDWQYINRFPLIISYSYNDFNYQYIIDDYLFFSSINELGNDSYEKSIYNYKY